MSTLPKETPKLEWDRYLKVTTNRGIVEELRNFYEKNQPAKVDAAVNVKAIEQEQQTTVRACSVSTITSAVCLEDLSCARENGNTLKLCHCGVRPSTCFEAIN